MSNRLMVLFSLALAGLCACSDDEGSPVAPTPPAPDVAYFVDGSIGDDSQNGSEGSPWATITHAVATAGEDVTINVAPATYDAAGGEVFPIELRAGQQLIGDVAYRGEGPVATRIRGQGAFVHGQMEGTVVIGGDGARVAGFTFATETNPNFYTGIAAVDSMVIEIDHNTFESSLYAGVGSSDGATPDIFENHFISDTYGMILDGSRSPLVYENVITGTSYGIRYFGAVDAAVLDNSIWAVHTGVQVGSGSSLIRGNRFEQTGGYTGAAIACSGPTHVIRSNWFASGPALNVTFGGIPDAGTVAEPGANDFSDITGVVVRHSGSELVTVIGNTWANYPPVVGTEIVITGTGSVVWE